MADIPRKSVETLGFRILNQACAVLTGIILARALGPYGKGIFTYVGSVLAVLVTISAGESSAISWQYKRLKRPSGDVLNAMLMFLRYGAVTVALVVGVCALLLPGQRPLLAVAIAVPFAFLSQMALGFFLADGNVRVCNIQSLITPTSFLLFMLLLLFVFHANLTGVLIAWVASFVLTALHATAKLRPYLTKNHGDVRATLKEQVVFGSKVTAGALVGLLNYRIDIFIILFMLGAKAVGVYSLAIGLGELMWNLSRPLAFSAFGTIVSGTRAEAATLIAKCVRHTLVFVSVGCLILFFIGPALITFVYGRAFSEGGEVLRFFLPGIIAYSMMPFISGFFAQQMGKPLIGFGISTLSTVICAIITVLTVRHLGIIAGALATSISYASAYLVSLVIFRRETGIPLRDLFALRKDDLRPYRTLLRSLWPGRRHV